MDTAVGLVEAYLRVNGYFTITEYPVIELLASSEYRSATDVDVLAFRFPGVSPAVVRTSNEGAGPGPFAPDPALLCPAGRADMIVGEVKEGRAELNRGATRPEVLRAVLTRFGCCASHDTDVVGRLSSTGRAVTPVGHEVRLVAFGTAPGNAKRYHTVLLGQVIEFLEAYLADRWSVLREAHFKDSALGMLALAHKARSGMGTAVRHGES